MVRSVHARSILAVDSHQNSRVVGSSLGGIAIIVGTVCSGTGSSSTPAAK